MAVSSFPRSSAGCHSLSHQNRDLLSPYGETNVSSRNGAMECRSVPTISVSFLDGESLACAAGSSFLSRDSLEFSSEIESPLHLTGPSVSHTRGASPQSGLRAYRPLYESFVATRSRVVQVKLSSVCTGIATGGMLFQLTARRVLLISVGKYRSGSTPIAPPLSMWTTKESGNQVDDSWIVFRTHDDACAFLSLSFPCLTLLPALEADLEPLEKLWRVDIGSKLDSHPPQLRMSLSTPDLHRRAHVALPPFPCSNHPVTHTEDFVLSSNPPNPRTTFRLGDWMSVSSHLPI
ncbi:hypothetical protein ID866_9897, partial [Astraeus odoratus]